MAGIKETIENEFSSKRILIIGDLVADQFLRGSISRVSREAPVFILKHENTDTMGGGAANAAVNVAALGGQAVILGVVGDDQNGKDLLSALSGVDHSHVQIAESFQTTTKLRVLAGQQYARRQQVIRVDYENDQKPGADLLKVLQNKAFGLLVDVDIVVISDYGYGVAEGVVTKELLAKAAELGKPVLVDSRSNTAKFKGATAATPNKEELEKLLDAPFSKDGCADLRETLELEALLVTLGNKGMYLVQAGASGENIAIVGKDEPVDVTGAGDTVIAAFSLGLACGLGYSTSARIANHAGGLAVMKKGTASINVKELLASIGRHENSLLEEQIGRGI